MAVSYLNRMVSLTAIHNGTRSYVSPVVWISWSFGF